MEKFHKTYGFISVGINILRSVSHTLYLAGPGHCTTFLSRATGQLKTCTFRLVLEGFLCVWCVFCVCGVFVCVCILSNL